MERCAGVLCPMFSVPANQGIGDLGQKTVRMIDCIADSGYHVWQILPLQAKGRSHSPYHALSSFAGDPVYINLDRLCEMGLLTQSSITNCNKFKDRVDYETVRVFKNEYFRRAFKAFKKNYDSFKEDFEYFEKTAFWLEDWAIYQLFRSLNSERPWIEWDEEYRNYPLYKEVDLSEYEDELFYTKFLQFIFYKQFDDIVMYAHAREITLISDVAFVNYDSADVWANPELFQMDEEVKPISVAGCPPDAFSADGQLWGNPVYKWDYHKQTGYTWWIKRIENSTKLYDVIRIDHFRGFDEYYAIPAGSKNAVIGKWEKGPGMDLFDVVKEKLGEISIIAEDLGYITDSVRQLVKDSNFPNMKVLEFAFDARDSYEPCEYLPFTYYNNCVVYTGTHDNETLLGWLKHINDYTLGYIKDYIGRDIPVGQEMVDEIIRLAHSSVADLCIIPLQDYLGLGNEARINTPSTLGDNWKWRVTKDKLTDKVADKIRKYTNVYRR